MNQIETENTNNPNNESVTEVTTPTQNAGSVREIFTFILIALVVVLPIRWFVAQPFIVSGASMENTFHNNEYLIVDQLSYHFADPKRGEVIVFRYPNDHTKYFIKRIIGLPGETVEIKGDQVTIVNDENPNGLTLSEPYINTMSGNSKLTVTLGDDEYFVMGDNRDHSSDSRAWGSLRKDEIIGRAWLRLFPASKISIMPGSHTTN